jgi:hypothetical protein
MAKQPHAPGDDTVDIEELLAWMSANPESHPDMRIVSEYGETLCKEKGTTLTILRSLTYLRLMSNEELIEKAREGRHSDLAIVLAERLEDELGLEKEDN